MSWSVLQTHPGASNGAYVLGTTPASKLPKAIKNLVRQGFEFFNPRFRKRFAGGGRVWYRPSQLFPDYVFVKPENRWRALNATNGVIGLLMSDVEKPAVIPDEFVEGLKRIECDESGLLVLPNASRFKVGEKVRVLTGPLSSVDLIYDGQRDRDRVFVLMKVLGSPRRVEVKEGNLVAA